MKDLRQLKVVVEHQRKILFEQVVPLPLQLGRQTKENLEPPPLALIPANIPSTFKLVTHPSSATQISRIHAIIQLENDSKDSDTKRLNRITSSTKLLLRNASEVNPLWVESLKQAMEPGSQMVVQLPLSLVLDQHRIRLEAIDEPSKQEQEEEEQDQLLFALQYPATPPGDSDTQQTIPSLSEVMSKFDEALASKVMSCIRQLLIVLQGAATTDGFTRSAAEAVVKGVGLDFGQVLFRSPDSGWETRASFGSDASNQSSMHWKPSLSTLERLVVEKRTLRFQKFLEDASQNSLLGVAGFVASPLLNRDNEVIGAIWGDRRQTGNSMYGNGITELDAMLVDALAGAVSAGIARLEYENTARQAQERIEQFFGPVLASQLLSNPDLLTNRECEVTILVCDVRGFSGFTERLGAELTLEWLSDVMDELGKQVLRFNGILVDQIGDEFLAMFGAPITDPFHASHALKAAQAMHDILPRISQAWESRIGGPTEVGIGMNTGVAIVGNTGFRSRFRYAPLGDAVNVASRVQGATKYFRATTILTQATANQVDRSLLRRLGKIRVVHRDQPVDVYELLDDSARSDAIRIGFEQALEKFESKEFDACTTLLHEVLIKFTDDIPSRILLRRAFEGQENRVDSDHPVWKLPGK